MPLQTVRGGIRVRADPHERLCGALRNKLLALAASLALAVGGAYVVSQPEPPSVAVMLAMEMGAHFESSGRHIGPRWIEQTLRVPPRQRCWRGSRRPAARPVRQ